MYHAWIRVSRGCRPVVEVGTECYVLGGKEMPHLSTFKRFCCIMLHIIKILLNMQCFKNEQEKKADHVLVIGSLLSTTFTSNTFD